MSATQVKNIVLVIKIQKNLDFHLINKFENEQKYPEDQSWNVMDARAMLSGTIGIVLVSNVPPMVVVQLFLLDTKEGTLK